MTHAQRKTKNQGPLKNQPRINSYLLPTDKKKAQEGGTDQQGPSNSKTCNLNLNLYVESNQGEREREPKGDTVTHKERDLSLVLNPGKGQDDQTDSKREARIGK